MSIETQDRILSMQMRRVLAFAKEQMPDSIIAIFSFTQGEDESEYSLSKIATNCQDRRELGVQVATVMTNFVAADVVNLSDVKGDVQ